MRGAAAAGGRVMSARLFPHGLAGVIFDCDGVLLDSRESNSIFYNRVLAVFGLPPMTPEQEKYCFMATAGQALRHIVPPALHQRIDEVVSHHVVYDRDIVPLLRLQEGFRPFVDDLRARGAHGCVHTNRRLHGIQRVLDIFALPSYFDPVVAADTAPKSSPEGAQRICAARGYNPADDGIVGDSEHDKTTAEWGVFAAFNAGPLADRSKPRVFDRLHAALAEALPALPTAAPDRRAAGAGRPADFASARGGKGVRGVLDRTDEAHPGRQRRDMARTGRGGRKTACNCRAH